jgi:hypothetical protein
MCNVSKLDSHRNRYVGQNRLGIEFKYDLDVDRKSLAAAEKNIANNGLQNRILLVQVTPTGPLFRHLFEDSMMVSE